jgi:hypothetical protein
MQKRLQFKILFLSRKTLPKNSGNFREKVNLYKDFNIAAVANALLRSAVALPLNKISGLANSIKNLFTNKQHTVNSNILYNLKVKRRTKII